MTTIDASAGSASARQLYRLLRADDQVDLLLELIDIVPTPVGSGAQLDPVAGGYLVLFLPPQHVGETVPTTGTELQLGQLAVFGDNTQLVFDLPMGSDAVPFTVEGILEALPRLRLVTDSKAGAVGPLPVPAQPTPATAVLSATTEAGRASSGADLLAERLRRSAARLPAGVSEPLSGAEADAAIVRSRSGGQARAQAQDQAQGPAGSVFTQVTELRFPSRLALSPRGGATRFRHAAGPVTNDGLVQLWHTRLTQVRADGQHVHAPADLIALESDEVDGGPADWQKRVGDDRLGKILDKDVRADLVKQTVSRPLNADQVVLSPLGAWLDAEREWSSSDRLRAYRHLMAMGRDLLVRVVERGVLFPLGHPAILTSTVNRAFPDVNGRVAALATSSVITVLESTRTYPDRDRVERGLPWSSVTLLTRSTPADPSLTETSFGGKGTVLRHPDGKPVTFRCLAVDRGGRSAEFDLPLVFVPQGNDLGPIAKAYNTGGIEFRDVSLGGQVLSVAPPSPANPEATDVVAETVGLRAHIEERPGSSARVTLTTSEIRGAVPSLQRFAPAAAGVQVLRFAEPYLQHAFGTGNNPGEVLLELVGGAPIVDLGDPAVTGGLVDPSFPLTAVSRLAGPVGGTVQALAGGKVKAADVLGELVGDVTLFGVFPIKDLIGDLDLDVAKDVPRLASRALDGISMPTLHWEVPLFKGGTASVPAKQEVDAGPVSGTISAVAGQQARLVVDVTTELQQPVDPAAPVLHSRATTRIENIALSLGLLGQPLVVVPVKEISVTSVDGRKPELDAKLGTLEFFGVLAFVRRLAALVPGSGFSDPRRWTSPRTGSARPILCRSRRSPAGCSCWRTSRSRRRWTCGSPSPPSWRSPSPRRRTVSG